MRVPIVTHPHPHLWFTVFWIFCHSSNYIVEKQMATHSSIIAWRIPWTEEPGGLLSMWSHRVGNDCSDSSSSSSSSYIVASHCFNFQFLNDISCGASFVKLFDPCISSLAFPSFFSLQILSLSLSHSY